MTKQEFKEIYLEVGYSQFAIDDLLKDRPSDIALEDLTRKSVRFVANMCKGWWPDWAIREDNDNEPAKGGNQWHYWIA